jgi:hypothetical protein
LRARKCGGRITAQRVRTLDTEEEGRRRKERKNRGNGDKGGYKTRKWEEEKHE